MTNLFYSDYVTFGELNITTSHEHFIVYFEIQ